MSHNTLTPVPPIIYPESDGKPMADNTLQFRWIVTLEGGLDVLHMDDDNVFVAGDLLWYPVEHHPEICQAPDAMVVFGRPKGERGSYKQWEEGGIAPQVAFEVISPCNTKAEMKSKLAFCDKYGVEEYYTYDPQRIKLRGWTRDRGHLQEIPDMQGWVSPRLKIRFEIVDGDLRITGPDGRRFVSFCEVAAQRNAAEDQVVIEKRHRRTAERHKKAAEEKAAAEKTQREAAEKQREDAEKQRETAEKQREDAEKQRETAERSAAQHAVEVARLRERLKSLGLDPDS